MTMPNYTIAAGSWILVTGANGFIASHVIDSLLSRGYKVRGTVRTEKAWLDDFFKSKYGEDNYESVVVPKLEEEGALDNHMKGICGVAHVAADMSYSPDPQSVIPNVIAATVNVLASSEKVSSVKRVVLTSSVTSALPRMPNGNGDGDMVIDADTWNDAAIEAAWDTKTADHMKPATVYTASKVEAERAAWKWMAEQKPHFEFNSVLPNMNFGKMLLPEKQTSSMGLTRLLLAGNDMIMKIVPRQWYVDVEDTARLHVIGLLDPNVQSERIFAAAHPFTWAKVLAVLRSLRPQNNKIPEALESEDDDHITIVPSKRAENLLQRFYGKGWTTLEESLARGISDLL